MTYLRVVSGIKSYLFMTAAVAIFLPNRFGQALCVLESYTI